jgi:hypothetical protein
MKMHVGVEKWLHEVLNLGTTLGTTTECGLDSFFMQHKTAFITAKKSTV